MGREGQQRSDSHARQIIPTRKDQEEARQLPGRQNRHQHLLDQIRQLGLSRPKRKLINGKH